MEACSNRKGQIADAAEVGLSQQNSPYVCVNLRGRWQWQSIKKISGKTFKDVQEQMYKNIHNCLQEKITGEKGYSIMISNCTTSSKDRINGKWRPLVPSSVKEGEFNAYGGERGLRFLYCVKKRVNNTMKYEWWIGVGDNMEARKGWGFLRQKTATTNSIAPWQVNKWLCWNMPGSQDGKWLEQPIKVEKMDNEWKICRAIEVKTKELAKQTQETIDSCNAIMNSTNEMINKHKEVSRELFNKLTKEERLAVVDTSKFRAVFKKNDLCSCCFSDAKTIKCIHPDCTGACAKCRGDNEDADCCACGKKQVLECPICQVDNFPPSFMKMFGCKHGVCYKCYSTAYELKRRLKKCPLCRVTISEPPE
tara:strand:+ start:1035 stop:2126 length:1092 start_codon:yes stop_codon:yes gene_type:complete